MGCFVRKCQVAGCEDKGGGPGECDEEVEGEAEKRSAETSGVGGGAEHSAGDGLRDANGVDVVAEVEEEDGVEDVEDCGESSADEDRFEERGGRGFSHGIFYWRVIGGRLARGGWAGLAFSHAVEGAGLDLTDSVAEIDLFGDDALGDLGVSFDLDAPGGVEESGDDDHGGGGTDEGEELAVDLGGGLPVFDVGEVDAGAVDVLDGAAGLFERGGDEGEALVGLLGDVGVFGAYGAGAGDVDAIADADGSGEADDGLVGRCAGDVRADRHGDIIFGLRLGVVG